MRSIEAALALDFARRGAKAFAVVMLTIIVIPLWCLEALDPHHLIEVASKEGVILHVSLTMVMGFGAAVAVCQAQGNLSRFFVRPISAARLVACQMTLGIVTACSMYACAAGLANLWGAQWPVLGPTLFLAAMLACGMAMTWSFEGSVLAQLIGISSTTVALFIWFSRQYGASIIGDWKVMWRAPTAADAFLLTAVTAIAFVVAVIGVARVRRGDRMDFSFIVRWWDSLWARSSAPARHRSAMAAQLWCEWRQKFAVVPSVLLVLFLVFPLTQFALGYMDAKTLLEVMIVVPWLAMLLFPLVIGLVLGNCGLGAGKAPMRHFMATQPVSDSFLAMALLRNAVLSLLAFFATWLVAWSLMACLLYLTGNGSHIYDALRLLFHPESNTPYILYLPMFCWALTGVVAALIATGRPWLWCLVMFSVFGLALSFFVVKMYVSDAVFTPLQSVVQSAWGAVMLLGTIGALAVAFRKNLLAKQEIAVVLLVWAGAAVLMRISAGEFFLHDLPWLALQVGLIAFAAAPLGVMPLAIAWNRHR